MNFEGFEKVEVTKLGGLVDWDDPTQFPVGVAVVCEDSKFGPDSVTTRDGLRKTMSAEGLGQITGVDVLKVLGNNPKQVALELSDAGVLYREVPDGSGTLVPTTDIPPNLLPTGKYMVSGKANNGIYMAFSDLKQGSFPPYVYDGVSDKIMRVSQNVIGAEWKGGIYYQVGDLLRTTDGRWWRCNRDSIRPTADVPPQIPAGYGFFDGVLGDPYQWSPIEFVGTVDNSLWEEWTPACSNQLVAPPAQSATFFTRLPGGGTLPGGKDLYLKFTFVIPQTGESPRSPATLIPFLGQNDAVQVGQLRMPRWMGEINLQPQLFAPFFFNVYAAIVDNAAPAPADSAYGLVLSQQNVGLLSLVTAVASNPSGIYRPTVATNNADIGALFNLANAYDGDLLTSALVFTDENDQGSVTYSGFPALSGSSNNPTLNVRSSGSTTGTGAGLAQYSFDNGVTFHAIWQGRAHALATDVVPLPANQDFTHVKVKFFGTIVPPGTNSISPYEIWIAADSTTQTTLFPPGAFVFSLVPEQPPLFIGVGGARFMAVMRRDRKGSLVSVDPDSPLKVNLQGNFSANIITISRVSSGGNYLVTAVLDDISHVIATEPMTVQNCDDPSFDGNFTILQVLPDTKQVTWNMAATGAASSTGGQVSIGSAPPPYAILPPSGPDGGQDIAAFTVANGPNAGPFFAVTEADPAVPFKATIVSFKATAGSCTMVLDDASGLAVGNSIALANTGFPALDGLSEVGSISGNTIVFASSAETAGTKIETGATATLVLTLPTTSDALLANIDSVSRDASAVVTAALDDVTNFAAGQIIIAAGTGTDIDGAARLRSVKLGSDGIRGTITWIGSSSTPATATQGTITGVPDMVLSFDDTALEAAEDLTAQLSAAPAPDSIDLFFSPTLRKMIYTTGKDSAHYVSQTDDPGAIDASSSALLVESANGKRTICVREMENGEVLSFKENGGYAIQAGADTPNLWGLARRWDKHGPLGPRAVGIGPDFCIFASRAGAYMYTGQNNAECVSLEIKNTWKRINWKFGYLIWIVVDEDDKVVHIGVPLDGATQISHELAVNYFSGWGEPIVLSRYGQLIGNYNGRKWSIQSIQAQCAAVVDRDLAVPIDSSVDTRQLLYGSGDQNLTGITAGPVTLNLSEGIHFALPDGNYFAVLAQIDENGMQVGLSPLFGIFNVHRFQPPPPQSGFFAITFAFQMPDLDSGNWRVYFGANQNALTQFTDIPKGATNFTVVDPGTVCPALAITVKVRMVLPDSRDDDGARIPHRYQPAFAQQAGIILRHVGANGQVIGNGNLTITPVTDDASMMFTPKTVVLDPATNEHFAISARFDSEYGSYLFTNGNAPGDWFSLQDVRMWFRKLFSARRAKT